MRGNSQAASARLRADSPARGWSAWLTRAREQRRQAQRERLETIVRMQAESRRARQSGRSRAGRYPRL
jgi:hypothetical protein